MCGGPRRRPCRWSSPRRIAARSIPPNSSPPRQLDPLTLRRSEDAFVDELFAASPRLGAPLLAARFPRAYLDVNREAWELDPAMFADARCPIGSTSVRRVCAWGLGTIARLVASGEEIYDGKLSFAEARVRVERSSTTRIAYGAGPIGRRHRRGIRLLPGGRLPFDAVRCIRRSAARADRRISCSAIATGPLARRRSSSAPASISRGVVLQLR